MNTWRKLMAICALALLPALARGEEAGGPALQWETSFSKALERAGKEKRLVLVDFWRENCVYCSRMDMETFKDPRVVQLLKSYVAARCSNTSKAQA